MQVNGWWLPCGRNSSYSFIPILLKLYRCLSHALKMYGGHSGINDNNSIKQSGFALAVAIVAICEDFYFLAPKI